MPHAIAALVQLWALAIFVGGVVLLAVPPVPLEVAALTSYFAWSTGLIPFAGLLAILRRRG